MASSCNRKDRRRSERVVLRMRITVIAEDRERERRRLEAMTRVVNAHSELVRIAMELPVGQPMWLTVSREQRRTALPSGARR